MVDPTWKHPVRVTVREINTYIFEFDAEEGKTEDEIIDEAMWMHQDPHFVRSEPTDVKFMDANIEYVSTETP